MTDDQKKYLGISIGIIIILLIVFVIFNNSSSNTEISDTNSETAYSDDSKNDVLDTQPQLDEQAEEPKVMIDEEVASQYQGTILGGSKTLFIDFNQEDYEKALTDGKVIFLEYYANWCPSCRAQEPGLIKGLELLDNPDVVAFRVNWNDSDTDDFEKQLADEHNVTAQHTKVVIKDGAVIATEVSVWDDEKTVETLSTY